MMGGGQGRRHLCWDFGLGGISGVGVCIEDCVLEYKNPAIRVDKSLAIQGPIHVTCHVINGLNS